MKSRFPLKPLGQVVQLGSRVYDSLMNSIVNGQMEFGAPLRLNEIARMLEVSTTPVREALGRLESSGLVVKVPNCGWFVREFTENEIRDMHEVRGSIEALSVRLACERITAEELAWLGSHQTKGQQVLRAGDADGYLIYNREFHGAILRAARNSYLTSIVGQLGPQSEMLTARSIRIDATMQCAFNEHVRILECLNTRNAGGAEREMKAHILNALVEFLKMRDRSSVKSRPHDEIEGFLLGRNAKATASEEAGTGAAEEART
jgi:DNA-binding GntR family transcriptional regulator